MSDTDVEINIKAADQASGLLWRLRFHVAQKMLEQAWRDLDRAEQIQLAIRTDLSVVQAEFEACRHEFTPGRMGWCVHERSGPGHEYLLVCGHEVDAEIHRTLRVILDRKVGTERKDTTP